MNYDLDSLHSMITPDRLSAYFEKNGWIQIKRDHPGKVVTYSKDDHWVGFTTDTTLDYFANSMRETVRKIAKLKDLSVNEALLTIIETSLKTSNSGEHECTPKIILHDCDTNQENCKFSIICSECGKSTEKHTNLEDAVKEWENEDMGLFNTNNKFMDELSEYEKEFESDMRTSKAMANAIEDNDIIYSPITYTSHEEASPFKMDSLSEESDDDDIDGIEAFEKKMDARSNIINTEDTNNELLDMMNETSSRILGTEAERSIEEPIEKPTSVVEADESAIEKEYPSFNIDLIPEDSDNMHEEAPMKENDVEDIIEDTVSSPVNDIIIEKDIEPENIETIHIEDTNSVLDNCDNNFIPDEIDTDEYTGSVYSDIVSPTQAAVASPSDEVTEKAKEPVEDNNFVLQDMSDNIMPPRKYEIHESNSETNSLISIIEKPETKKIMKYAGAAIAVLVVAKVVKSLIKK